ncbi:unnamed protein product [Medioppia subpectinata]|uniref:NADP-dependent oxidoreductase domain-containing protein n=1 Tax=Medioppia subpectinata TaxID=1979941 RepID=A0A7R9KRS7_9ACAR|nr:unnamed protein product [Medioppia subpectinata]CAG2108661.1 unnamed protein product [Medioppia subpectinata]
MAIKDGIRQGFRHIDTSWFFHNERDVGQALREAYDEGLVTRDDLFIVYKVWPKNSNFKRTQNVIKQTLKELNTTYLDFVSIQWPLRNNTDIYRALEWAYDQRMARSIGVSNFKPTEITELMTMATVKPAINHIRIHPGLNQDETIEWCHREGIAVAGWSPLGTGSLITDPTLVAIGQKYNKTSAQVMIRWQIQRGLIVVPKSTKLSRIVENSDVFDFELREEDMSAIHDMPQIALIEFWG